MQIVANDCRQALLEQCSGRSNGVKSNSNNSLNLGFSNPTPITVPKFNQRHDWEIDPAKLLIKSVIARGTFGTVHRGVYDGQDVAGLLFHFTIFVLI